MEIVTLSYPLNRMRINITNITRLSRSYIMGRYKTHTYGGTTTLKDKVRIHLV
jgi:hypothetical protein